MLDFTLLSKYQCCGDTALHMFKKRGSTAAITDYAFLLGAVCVKGVYYKERNELENRAGYYWTKTVQKDLPNVEIILSNTGSSVSVGEIRYFGVRPAIKYSYIEDYCKNKIETKDGAIEVEFGEYPQKVVSKELQEELNEFNKKLGSYSCDIAFTKDFMPVDDFANGFEPEFLLPRYYKGKKYVLVRACTEENPQEIILSNGEKYKSNDKVWIEILPVKWLVDEKEDIAVSEKILFSGIQFNNSREYDGEFQNTDLKKYLDERFSNEITAYLEVKPESIVYDVQEEFKNAYEFDFEKVTEEDLIRGSLESNIAPFLHGKSSDGKSARIKEFDPDAEIVYLRNATPDSLNGKSIYNAEKNEMIDVPPTWYVKLKEKCEKEPDKLHIVFFDELTNALPSIQGMAFNILDKEINGKWKLPENARVAAAGNDLEDSLAANTMAEPLFNRFNHVYINTTVEDWLKWALTPNNSYERLDYKKKDTSKELKIHPAIYAFIASKKEKVLRTRYNGVKPNADPRKWEMASKVLYQTNNPYMLRGLIGEELTNEFVFFCQTKVITLEDVINGNYNNNIFEINSSKSYLTALALSNVDEENLEVVRNFIEKLGKEYLALFDFLWTIGDDERLEKLMNLKQGKVKVKK